MAADKIVLTGTERAAPQGAQRIGEPDASEPAELTIVVRRRAQIPPHSGGVAQYSRADFAAQFGADPADLQKVADYATSQGLTIVSSSSATRTVAVRGTIGELRDAFSAEISLFQQDGKTFRARTGVLTIPADLDGIIEGIFGFDQRQQARMHMRRRPVAEIFAAAAGLSYSPLDVAAAYQFPQGVNGAGQTIGIVELGGGYQDSDLSTYFSGLGINPAPNVISVGVDGAANQPGADPQGADGEVELDIEVAGAVAPGANIVVYFAPNTDKGFLDAITSAVHDTANNPGIVSISWGGAENTFTAQSLKAYDQAFQDAAALGVTICVASGDDGSNDQQNDGQAHADFPAASPNVLACGGTNLQASNGSIQSETVWNHGVGQGASGGGISENFPVPGYQANAGVPVSVNASQFAGRGVPDVSGDADPSTGYNVFVDGNNTVVGGTSAVAPLWAGLVALLNQQLGKNVGFLNPSLYNLVSPTTFNDITQGNNGAYSAGPGWDACTGLGSPIGTGLLQALQSAVAPPTPPVVPQP